MTKTISKFNPKPTNEPSEEQYMTNKNANETLRLQGLNRDNMDEKIRGDRKNNFKIKHLQAIDATSGRLESLFSVFIGFSLPEVAS